MISVYDAEALLNEHAIYKMRDEYKTIYDLDSVKINISSKKVSEDLVTEPNYNFVNTLTPFKSRELTITASRKGYKTLKQTIKVSSLNSVLEIFLTKEDE